MFISFFVGRMFVVFKMLKSLGTRKKKKWCFAKRKIKKTPFEHPFFFPLPPFHSFLPFPPSLPMPFFFSITILSKSNFNTQVTLESQTTTSM
jgi:hypothetical protein